MAENDNMTCQYQTGRTLGRGNFAVVKEAVHIKTGQYFACKVISKKLMEGRENMVRTEISVLSKISSGHRNVVTLHDYFETANNVYLCFDLCTGGQLLQRVCSRGKFHEPDAANLVKKICGAIEYIHKCGIIHRDLKPENLLFDSPADDAEIMIADFGLSRVVEEDKFHAIIEVCGTPGYIAPEVYQQRGHGPAVDIWALGIITYYLLSGYIPFNRASTSKQLYDNTMGGFYAFEPERYWVNVSDAGKGFIRRCLTVDPESRPGAGVLGSDEVSKCSSFSSLVPDKCVEDSFSCSGWMGRSISFRIRRARRGYRRICCLRSSRRLSNGLRGRKTRTRAFARAKSRWQSRCSSRTRRLWSQF